MKIQTRIDSSSVVLVSGGARGITAQCVIALARTFQSKFILVGRSALDSKEPAWSRGITDEGELKKCILADLQAQGEKASPNRVQKIFSAIHSSREIESTLKKIEDAGGQALYLSADIADTASLREKLSTATQRFGPVTGLIHGAGSLADKLIEKKSRLDFEMVYSPKINGLKSLLECIPMERLDFLVLFSSIVSVYGNVGQTDYAIANQILDQSARLIQRAQPNCRVISINWGPWEGGMVTPALKKLFAERHVELISVESGAETLVQLLSANPPTDVQVVVGKPPLAPAQNPNNLPAGQRVRRKLSLEANPYLKDHMIGESPVLPATCAAAWMINTCEQLYPGYTFFRMENFKVLKGLVFDDHLAGEHTVEIQRVSADVSQVSLTTRISSLNPLGKTFFHYSARIQLCAQLPAAEILPLPEVGDPILVGETLYQNGTLFHGPSLQGIDQIYSLEPDRLVMRCFLPGVAVSAQGQFPVQTCNPFLNDAIVQCLLVWSQHFDQAPCLPSSLEILEEWLPIEFDRPYRVTLEVRKHTPTAVTGDILVQQMDGSVAMKFTALEGTISQLLNNRIGTKA